MRSMGLVATAATAPLMHPAVRLRSRLLDSSPLDSSALMGLYAPSRTPAVRAWLKLRADYLAKHAGRQSACQGTESTHRRTGALATRLE